MSEPIQVERFSGFAEFYDEFMSRLVNYSAWVDYIISIFKNKKVVVQTILDLACGSGIPTLLFAQKRYQVVGLDISKEMLKVFKDKLVKNSYCISLIQADMRNFTIPEKVDAVVCLYDSMNYLLTVQDLLACFNCVSNCLKPNGLFVFDMNTIYCLASFWDNRETPRQIGDIYSLWRNRYNPQSQISTLQLTVYTNDGRLFREIHQERGYEESVIRDTLLKANFQGIDFYEHLTFRPINNKTLRMMVVAQK